MKTKKMVTAALLVSLGIVIPTISIPIIPDPAVSATLAAHVPIIVAMFISPFVAIVTALGTTLGFILKGLPIVVSLRAFSHIIFAIVGSLMLVKINGKPFNTHFIWLRIFIVYIVTLILHTASELLVIRLIAPDTVHMMVGMGIFMLHHTIDFAISIAIVQALKSVRGIDAF